MWGHGSTSCPSERISPRKPARRLAPLAPARAKNRSVCRSIIQIPADFPCQAKRTSAPSRTAESVNRSFAMRLSTVEHVRKPFRFMSEFGGASAFTRAEYRRISPDRCSMLSHHLSRSTGAAFHPEHTTPPVVHWSPRARGDILPRTRASRRPAPCTTPCSSVIRRTRARPSPARG